jgi:hypothetical protein
MGLGKLDHHFQLDATDYSFSSDSSLVVEMSASLCCGVMALSGSFTQGRVSSPVGSLGSCCCTPSSSSSSSDTSRCDFESWLLVGKLLLRFGRRSFSSSSESSSPLVLLLSVTEYLKYYRVGPPPPVRRPRSRGCAAS